MFHYLEQYLPFVVTRSPLYKEILEESEDIETVIQSKPPQVQTPVPSSNDQETKRITSHRHAMEHCKLTDF